jgi:transcriptional regulator with XRE-family HTH domain
VADRRQPSKRQSADSGAVSASRRNGPARQTTGAAGGEIGNRVAARRRDLGWSLAAVASRAGVSPTTVMSLEHGELTVQLDKFLCIVQVLGLSAAELLAPDAPGSEPTGWSFKDELQRRARIDVGQILAWLSAAQAKPAPDASALTPAGRRTKRRPRN